jgi:hypothetical protein
MIWIGPRTANRPMSPAIRTIARALGRDPPVLAIAVEGDAVKLHSMVDEPEAELFGDALLKLLQLLVDELDHIAGLDVDQMIVVRIGGGFVSRTPITELMPLENARFLEQPHGPIDRRNRDVRVDRRCAGVKGLDIGMIIAVTEHASNDLALLGDTKSFVGA